MEKLVYKTDSFHWTDILNPSKEELDQIAQQYNLPSILVQDCLDAEHLPKFERNDDLNFVILRAYDEVCHHDADTVQELTRKLAIFYSKDFMLTIHRKEQNFIERMTAKYEKKQKKVPMISVLHELMSCVFETFEKPVDDALTELEKLEMSVFGTHGATPFHVRDGYFLKRKAFVFKRMVRLSIDVIGKMSNGADPHHSRYQDLKEQGDSLFFYADELMESINSLLSLHISLSSQATNEASHRTNEVMRVLTVFSVFLLPLNVITGIYGMNFKHMPELETPLGYPVVLMTMAAIVIAIYLWFRKQGWMK